MEKKGCEEIYNSYYFVLLILLVVTSTDERTLVCFRKKSLFTLTGSRAPVEIAGYETEELEFVIENPRLLAGFPNIPPWRSARRTLSFAPGKPRKTSRYGYLCFAIDCQTNDRYVISDIEGRANGKTGLQFCAVGARTNALIGCFDEEVVIEDGLTVKALKPARRRLPRP